MLKCFNHLGVCLGKKGTYATIDMITKSFDQDVLKWKEDVQVCNLTILYLLMYDIVTSLLDVDPCLSLDSPFLDSSALEDLYQFCAI